MLFGIAILKGSALFEAPLSSSALLARPMRQVIEFLMKPPQFTEAGVKKTLASMCRACQVLTKNQCKVWSQGQSRLLGHRYATTGNILK